MSSSNGFTKPTGKESETYVILAPDELNSNLEKRGTTSIKQPGSENSATNYLGDLLENRGEIDLPPGPPRIPLARPRKTTPMNRTSVSPPTTGQGLPRLPKMPAALPSYQKISHV